jgi:hypothetical protein
MQRCLFALDTKAHVEILRVAAGIIPDAEATHQTNNPPPYYRMLIAQQQALDLLNWLMNQWRVNRDK